MFKQLAKALRDAQLHQSLQVFVFPHPNHVSLNSQPCNSPSHMPPLLPAVLSVIQCCDWSSSHSPLSCTPLERTLHHFRIAALQC